MPILRFTVDGPPMGKPRHRMGKNKKTGKFFSFSAKKGKQYEQHVFACLLEKTKRVPQQLDLNTPVGCTIHAYYPIPKSWSKKKIMRAELGMIRPTVKPDVDNVAKAVLDGLKLFFDDKQVTKLVIQKYYSHTPRVDVILEW